MNQQQYSSMLNYMHSHSALSKLAVYFSKGITYVAYAFYPLLILFLFVSKNPNRFSCLLVPAVGFVALSIFRALLNSPRPYEKYDIPPLYNKATRGKSFPSRHTFCVFIIAVTAFFINCWLGIIFFVLGILLSFSRVLCGVHFIKDVLAGAVTGIVFGIVGYYII